MRISRVTALCLISCMALTVMASAAFATNDDKNGSGRETFSALADILPVGATRDVRIYIDSYSSDQDAQQLNAALVDGGPDAVLKTLEKMKSIGRIEREGTVSFYDFKYIRSTPTPSGRHILAVTDRPIAFREEFFGTRSTQYPIGILQLDLKDDKKGKEEGEGTLVYAAQIRVMKGEKVDIENFGIQPIRLLGVREL